MVTIVVPVYNEEKRWDNDYWNNLIHASRIRFIFVNDGSTDKSEIILNSLICDSRHEVITLSKNMGKSEAIRVGMLTAIQDLSKQHESVNLIGYLDSDPAFAVSDILKICEETKERLQISKVGSNFESVWASRVALSGRTIVRKKSRHYIGRIIHSLLGLFIHELPYDSQCGFKIFAKSERLELTLEKPFRTRWFVDLEILLRWRNIGIKGRHIESNLKIWEEPLDFWIDVQGSALSLKNFWMVIKEMIYLIKLSRNK